MGSQTPRYKFPYPVASDSTNVPNDIQNPFNVLDANVVMEYEGPLASRTTPGIFGRRYYATDNGIEYLDTGTSWIPLGPINSASGNISTSNPGASASAGSVGLAADAGHTHAREPVSTASDLNPSSPTAQAGSTGKWVDAGHVHPGGHALGDIRTTLNPSTIPTGWLVADGTAVSRSYYQNFYTALGGPSAYPYGQGDGSTTFNLPNLIGRTFIGTTATNTTYPLGATSGQSTITLSQSNLPSHEHPISDPGHFHPLYVDPASGGGTGYQILYTIPGVGTTILTGSTQGIGYMNFSMNYNAVIKKNTTGITATSGTTFSNQPVSTVQPSINVIYIVKVL